MLDLFLILKIAPVAPRGSGSCGNAELDLQGHDTTLPFPLFFSRVLFLILLPFAPLYSPVARADTYLPSFSISLPAEARL